MGRFIIKHIANNKPQIVASNNNIQENNNVMTTEEKIALAQEALGVQGATVKRVKKDKGLIERTESSKTILTEDNKELLND
jgi:hypothetical protein